MPKLNGKALYCCWCYGPLSGFALHSVQGPYIHLHCATIIGLQAMKAHKATGFEPAAMLVEIEKPSVEWKVKEGNKG